jgi:RNA polymerase sigma factor (sigma-70 family)
MAFHIPFRLRRLEVAADPLVDDSELLQKFAGGDARAFESLVQRHGQTVLGVCWRLLGDSHAAEDAFQATFLQLARYAHRLDASGTLSGWLYTSARRIALRARRMNFSPLPPDLEASNRHPLDVLSARELLAAIEDEIARLSEPYRIPLVLCYLDGLSKRAAAARLGLPAGVFRGRLDRGREKLRIALMRRGLAPAALLGLLTPTASADLVNRTLGVCIRGQQPSSPAVTLLAAGRLLSLRKTVIGAVLLVLTGGLCLVAAVEPDGMPGQPQPAVASRQTDREQPSDPLNDPLPPHAIARMGSLRWRYNNFWYQYIISPTGNAVAIPSGSTLPVMSLKDGRMLCEISMEKGSTFRTRFTQDGSRLMVVGDRGIVQFFDTTTGKPDGETRPVVDKDVARVLESGQRESTSHKFTKDGQWLFTTHPKEDGRLLILTEIAPKPGAIPREIRLELPEGFGKSVTIDDYACTSSLGIGVGRDLGNGGHKAFRWDLSSGKLTSATRIKVQAFGLLSPDGKHFVTCQGGLHVWDTENGNEVVKLDEPVVRGFDPQFSPDGKRVVGIVNDQEDKTKSIFVVVEVDSGKVVGRLKLPNQYTFPFLLPDNRTLLATDKLMVTTWDIETGCRLNPTVGHESSICYLAFSPDGTTLYTASHSSTESITAWDASTGKKHRDLATPGGYARFALAPSGVVSIVNGGESLIWADEKTGKERRRIALDPIAVLMGGRIWGGGIRLSSCHDPKTGRQAIFGIVPSTGYEKIFAAFWDASSGELLTQREFDGHPRDMDVRVSPDGRLLARELNEIPPGEITTDKANLQAIVFENSLTGERLQRINQPDYLQANSICFTPDGHSLFTWTTTILERRGDSTPAGITTIRMWEVWSGKQRQTFALPAVTDSGLYEPEAIAVSKDGRWLAAARPDKTIYMWEIATGKEVAKRSGYRARVGCLAFRPDGKAVASGHRDGTAVVWDLSGLTPTKPAAIDRETAWKDLASHDAAKAYRASLALSADSECVAFFRQWLKPIQPAPAGEVNRLIDELNSEDFQIREKATTALTQFGDRAYSQLRDALRKEQSLEQRSRVEGILKKGNRLTESDPERLRSLRCIEVLERVGSSDARTLLSELAKGTTGAPLTRESANALLHFSHP